eukprot:SAG11_NODE_2107_length_3810_cov_7.214228_3_plen_61_part_00
MLGIKDDTAVWEHMVKLGHLNPLQGQHKPKVGCKRTELVLTQFHNRMEFSNVAFLQDRYS